VLPASQWSPAAFRYVLAYYARSEVASWAAEEAQLLAARLENNGTVSAPDALRAFAARVRSASRDMSDPSLAFVAIQLSRSELSIAHVEFGP
jgi:hypothetical protein